MCVFCLQENLITNRSVCVFNIIMDDLSENRLALIWCYWKNKLENFCAWKVVEEIQPDL